MTTEEFIKTTQPIVDLVTAVAKIKYGEHSERYLTIIASVMDAQAKKDDELLFDFLDAARFAIDYIAYKIEKEIN